MSGKTKIYTRFILIFLLSLVATKLSGQWKILQQGLQYAEFESPQKSIAGDSKITVIKIDPNQYELKLFCAGEKDHGKLTAPEWCERYDLIGCINAGIFQTDQLSNVGYMKNFQYVNNPRIHQSYQSVTAFNPLDSTSKPFRIFDMDAYPMQSIINEYNTVIQNLRLIKYPGTNRWSQQKKMWSEAAMGEDRDGHVLFIFSRSPYSMHDLNNIISKFPVGLVRAQHLEGGPEASLYFSCGDFHLMKTGSYESGFNENDHNAHFWPIPNVVGILKKNKM